jgi:hypothetical protein
MGEVVDLVDKPFRGKNYPGVTDFDLIRVNMTPASTSSINLAGWFDQLTGRIGRLELESSRGDGIHMGAGCHDLVVEEGYVYVHDVTSSLHWDAIQVLGGYRVTFKNLVVLQRSPDLDREGRCVFVNAGVTPPDIEDVVFENCYFETHRDPISTKDRVFTLQGSIRSGARNCYFAEAKAGVAPYWVRTLENVIDPVDEGNVIIPRSQPLPLHL